MARPPTRSTLTALLKRIGGELDALDRRWAVVGGLAIHAHRGGGSLDDIDIAVETADDTAAEQLVRELQERGFTAITDVEQEDAHRLASVRLVSTEDPNAPPVQLLFASSGVEPEILRDAVVASVLGLEAPVAAPGHLIAMKVLSHGIGRPQDSEDIASLLQRASEDDLRTAEDALVLIEERGFDRGRDLRSDYEVFLARDAAARDG